MNTRWIAMFFIMWSMAAGPGDAASQVIDPDVGLPLFLKIITYDDDFHRDGIKAVRIYVVYDHRIAESYSQYRGIEAFQRENEKLRVKRLPVEFIPVPVDGLDRPLEMVSSDHYNLMLVTSVGDLQARALSDIAQSYGMHSFALDPEYVALGLTVGVRPNRDRPSIIINLESSRKEGSKFSAHLLKMCEIL